MVAIAGPGDVCAADPRRGPSPEHCIVVPGQDLELQAVHRWLVERPLKILLANAVDDAVKYVLDGSRSGRFDLDSPEVDSDERASVGTKLQYRVIDALGLVKERPLDTTIDGVPVDIKGTVRTSWTIPKEAQCEICILIRVDPKNDRFAAWLMRTHRRWLNNGKNQDSKRTIIAEAKERYSLPLVDWTPLPPEPLKLLSPTQRAVVFAPRVGQRQRLSALFGYLPDVVIPRSSIETVCAGNKDALRRAREAKPDILRAHGLEVLVGTWPEERQRALDLGFDLSGEAWVAVSPGRVEASEIRVPEILPGL